MSENASYCFLMLRWPFPYGQAKIIGSPPLLSGRYSLDSCGPLVTASHESGHSHSDLLVRN